MPTCMTCIRPPFGLCFALIAQRIFRLFLFYSDCIKIDLEIHTTVLDLPVAQYLFPFDALVMQVLLLCSNLHTFQLMFSFFFVSIRVIVVFLWPFSSLCLWYYYIVSTYQFGEIIFLERCNLFVDCSDLVCQVPLLDCLVHWTFDGGKRNEKKSPFQRIALHGYDTRDSRASCILMDTFKYPISQLCRI